MGIYIITYRIREGRPMVGAVSKVQRGTDTTQVKRVEAGQLLRRLRRAA
ncbi:MAG: hypothetical protein ABF811_00790 [Pseudoclavibacter sp.]